MATNEHVKQTVTIDFQVQGRFWFVDSRLYLEDGFYAEAIDYQKIASAYYAAARQLQGIE